MGSDFPAASCPTGRPEQFSGGFSPPVFFLKPLSKEVFPIFRRHKAPAVQTADFIVAGLGNPGRKYETTRHNAGFMALDLLAERLGAGRLTSTRFQATYAVCEKNGLRILLMKPQTFMNLSGEAVRDMAHAFSVPPERIVVVFDDISLAAGRIRVRRSGSAGGHNGIKSIIYQLQSDAFPRVKIGVGAPQKGVEDMRDFVLDTLDSDAYDGVKMAPDAVLAILERGVDAAMQEFNGKTAP